MAREKNWTFSHNFQIRATGTALEHSKAYLLALKNKLVASGYWAVVGSCNGVTYQYQGITAGPVWDLWTTESSLVKATAYGTAHSWCVLAGPGGIYFSIQWVTTTDPGATFWFFPEMPLPGRDGNPLADYIRNDPLFGIGHNSYQMERYVASTSQNGQFGACDDGSWYMTTNRGGSGAFTGLQLFSTLEDAAENGWPYVSYLQAASDLSYIAGQTFRLLHATIRPENTNFSGAILVPHYASATRVFATMGADSVGGGMPKFPVYVSIRNAGANPPMDGLYTVYGRIGDVYLCPESLLNGDVTPASGGVEYFVYNRFLWLPCSTTPVLL